MRKLLVVASVLVLAGCSTLSPAQNQQLTDAGTQLAHAGTDALDAWITDAITNWANARDGVTAAEVSGSLATCLAACNQAAPSGAKSVPAPSAALVDRFRFLAGK